jgi:hypothetical protein
MAVVRKLSSSPVFATFPRGLDFVSDLLLPRRCIPVAPSLMGMARSALRVGLKYDFYRDRSARRVVSPLSLIMVWMLGVRLVIGNRHFMNVRGRCFAMMVPADKLSWPLNMRIELPAYAGMMAQAGSELLRDADLIVPVPLHRRRLISRRYNQSALLALALAKVTSVAALPDLLVRTRATPIQGGLGAKARHRNVAGAFAVRPGRETGVPGVACR